MINIDYKNRKPIYEQLVDNIKALVLTGVLERDEQLPSIRQLATDLAINPNTIQKAYAELERQGITYSLKGRGCFVASNINVLRDDKCEQLYRELVNIINELQSLGASNAEILGYVQKVCQNEVGKEGVQ